MARPLPKASAVATDASASGSRPSTSAGRGSPWSRSRAQRTARPRKRRWLRRLGQATALLLVATLLLWIAIHRVPWLGPALAEGTRKVFGPRFVAWVEDVAYGIQDRVDRWRYGGNPPKAYWDAPGASATAPDGGAAVPAPSGPGGGAAAPTVAAFFPSPFEPPFPDVAAAADGIWVPIPDARVPDAPVTLYKTMVHPDPRRPYAVLAVVAVDTRSLDLELQAGTREPTSYRVLRTDRPGTVPAAEHGRLVAAFNGGFRATHGQYGMMLRGVEYLPPRDFGCTLARYVDGSLRIGVWSDLKVERDRMVYYRQTPPCLVERGDTHQMLKYQEYAKGWGATVSGETVIRRSAIGLDRERKILLYGIGDGMTAQGIARGMLAAGAFDAAELDVNYAYPRFLFYEQPAGAAVPTAVRTLIPGVEFTADEYVARPCERDFFYLVRAVPSAP